MGATPAVPIVGSGNANTGAPLQANNPLMPAGVPGTAGGATSAAANPMVPATGAVPTASSSAPATTAGVAPVQSNGVNWVNGSDTVIGDFSDSYGTGTGEAITSVLQGMGTDTSNAVTATNAVVNQESGLQLGNMQAQLAASGISPNSSTSALETSNFESQVNTGLQSTDANLELNEENTLLSSLESEGSAHGADSSFLGSLGDVLSGSESALSAMGGGVGNVDTTGSSSPLEMIGELAGL